MNPFIFVHIPKTAGTSLRVSLSNIYNGEELLCDYGVNSRETSQIVKERFYEKNDVYALIQASPKAIYGHFPVKKYANITKCSNIVTFVRDPIERVVSEYKHFQRVEGFTSTLEEFASTERFRNCTQKFLVGMPWSAIGFIGLSERYEESLSLLSNKLSVNLCEESLNRAPVKQALVISDEQRRMLIELNRLDVEIYESAKEIFEWRIKLTNSGQRFINGGWLANHKRGTVHGFAYHEQSDEAVSLTLLAGDEEIGRVTANKFHAAMHKFNAPRAGYVGFSIPAPENKRGKLKLINTDTAQPIPFIGLQHESRD